MVVEVGFTVTEPIRVLVLTLPGVIATDDALVMFQERVLVPAEATTVGDAEKEEMVGVIPDCVVPAVLNDFTEMFPALSYESTE
jgi:hypothetical protein